jgi:hypothetical protein
VRAGIAAATAVLVVAVAAGVIARSGDDDADLTIACAGAATAGDATAVAAGGPPTSEQVDALASLTDLPGIAAPQWVALDSGNELTHAADVFVSGAEPEDGAGTVTVTARGEADGAVRWTATFPGDLELATLVGYDDVVGVLVSDPDGRIEVHVLAATDGAELACTGLATYLNGWRVDAVTGSLLVGTYDDWLAFSFAGFDAETGLAAPWSTIHHGAVLGDGLVVVTREVPTGGIELEALEGADGTVRWTTPVRDADGRPFGGRADATTVVGGGVVVVLVEQRGTTEVVALDGAAGVERWRVVVPTRAASPGIVDGTLLLGVSDTVPGLCDDLICGTGLDVTDGTVRWSEAGVIHGGSGSGVVELGNGLAVTTESLFGGSIVDPATGFVGEVEGGLAAFVAGDGTLAVMGSGGVVVFAVG